MDAIRTLPEVAAALRDGRPVVALESAVLTTGLPRRPLTHRPPLAAPDWNDAEPVHLETMRLMQRTVRSTGAVPATIAILDGQLRIGLEDEELIRLAGDPHAGKAAAGDVASVLHRGGSAGTTVSATLLACRLASPAPIRVFATGGIGGVHRGWANTPDISADLLQIARTPVCVVCSGAKTILDIPATVEALHALGVPILGYRTNMFPRFICPPDDNLPVTQRVDSAADAAAVCHLHLDGLDAPGGLLLVQPVEASLAIDADELEPLVEAAEADAAAHGVAGPQRTPHVLAWLAARTDGRALDANLALLVSNARLAADVAQSLADASA